MASLQRSSTGILQKDAAFPNVVGVFSLSSTGRRSSGSGRMQGEWGGTLSGRRRTVRICCHPGCTAFIPHESIFLRKGMCLTNDPFQSGGVQAFALNLAFVDIVGTTILEDSSVNMLGQRSGQSTVFGGKFLRRSRFW